MPETRAVDNKLKVFISYSRKDLDFARQIVSALEARGLAPKIDTRDLPKLEDWRRELLGFIREADAVVFIVSPRSISSPVCGWEAEQVAKFNKRLAPIVLEQVPIDQLPPVISRINYILFDPPNDFESRADELAKALQTDLPWLKEHTRLGELAREWSEAGGPDGPHPVGLLLRSPALEGAEHWLATQPQRAPPPADITRVFISESRKAEQSARARARRRNRAIGGLVVLLIGTVLSLWRRDEIQRFVSNVLHPFTEWHQWYVVMQPSLLNPEQERALVPQGEFSECVHFCPRMVVVPAGSFVMGSPDTETHRDGNEGPQHRVTFARPYAVGKFEVTFAEWDACADAEACSRPPDSGWGRGNQPVINVSWREALRYVEWLSKMTGKQYRLLSEAEWEYAARAGSRTVYWWGDEIGEGNANCDGCGSQWNDDQTAPVDSFKPNAFGLYNMLGNVWEWVEDCYNENYANAPSDGSASTAGDCTKRIVRGGSWYEIPQYLRSANRVGYHPERQSFLYGFRVARTLPD